MRSKASFRTISSSGEYDQFIASSSCLLNVHQAHTTVKPYKKNFVFVKKNDDLCT